MIVLDTTIVNVALPSIRTDLGFSRDLARLGRERVPAHLRRLPAPRRPARRPLRPPPAVPRRHHALHAGLARCGLANSQGFLVGARAVQGVGGAVASAVSLSLMMNLFTEPAERAKAMGVFGFVASGGGTIGVLLGGVLTNSLDWHWIFLVNLPIGVARRRALPAAAAGAARAAAAARRRRRGHGDRVADARRVRDRQRQPGRLDVRPDARPARPARAALLALFLVIESRVSSPLMPLGLFRLRNLATANVVGVLWAAAMFAWFFLSALYLQLVLGYSPLKVGLAFLPANLIMGALSIGLSAEARHALRHQAAARGRALARGRRARALRARAGRRQLPRRRPAEHDPARHRRRHRLQPGAARRDERRRAGGGGPRLGRRQHRRS